MVRFEGSQCTHRPSRVRFVWAATTLLLIPLHDTRAVSAQAEYNRVHELFVHGYLSKSQIEADKGYRRYIGSNPEWALKFQLQEAEAMVWRGLSENTLSLLSEPPVGQMKSNPEVTTEKLTLEGLAFAFLQQLPAADQHLAQAGGLCAIQTYASCGRVFQARGILAVWHNQLPEAQQFLLESLSFARAHNDRRLEATTQSNLGWLFLQNERNDEAVGWLESAYRTAAALGAEDQEQAASGNLGWVYFGLGDSERALALFIEAGKRAKDLGNIRAQLTWLKTTAYVYRDYGELERAKETLRQALDLATQINSQGDIVGALEDLSHVSVEIGDLDAASAYIARVTPLVRASGNGLDISYVSLAQGKLAAARHQDAQAERLFRAVEHDPASQVSMRFGAEHELAKLYEAEGHAVAAQGMYRTALNTFEGARDQLKGDDLKLPFLANAKSIYDDYIHFLVTQGKTEEALVTADQSRARTLAQGLGVAMKQGSFHPAFISPRAVARKAGATLLFYWLGAKQSYLWAITPEKIALFTLPAQKEITPLLDRYRKALLGTEDPLLAANSTGQELYRMLVAPSAKLIRPDVPVMILADGPLSQLNFETLMVPGASPGQAPHYWIEDATLIAAPSLAMLAAAKPERAAAVKAGNVARGKLLLLGDPVSPSVDYPELPYAAQEMTQIGKHFALTDEVVFKRQQATPGAYLASDPRQFSYIHFVSHGVASRTDPLDSAIILSKTSSSSQANTKTSGADDNQDSFKLYAREIMRHPIDARLVTISACYGSGIRAYAGEGLVGLSWAFLRAGAHNVIGALWEASDDATARLMDTMYQGLHDGQSPDAALRHAKLALLHSQGHFRKPFYWAPFQIYAGH
jgi:CHAT domain-containing protein